MNRFLTLSVGAAVLLRTIPACATNEVFPVVHNEPIAVRVVDGKHGSPLPHEHVVLVAGYDRRDLNLALWREEAVTDAEGKVRLSNALRNLPLLRVEVLKRHICAAGAGDAVFSVERVRLNGLSGANRCGIIALVDAPGMLTVFVKGKKGDAAAGVVAQPIAVAFIPVTIAVTIPVTVLVAVPASTSAPIPQANPAHGPEPVNRPAAGHEARFEAGSEAGPAAESDLPPIPFVLLSPAELSDEDADKDADEDGVDPLCNPAAGQCYSLLMEGPSLPRPGSLR
jgi:hypothetical protein